MKTKNYTFLALAIPFMIALVGSGFFCSCSSEKDNSIENRCPYEGSECPNAQKYMRDFQIEVYNDSVYVYEGDKQIGAYVTDWKGKLDSVMLTANP